MSTVIKSVNDLKRHVNAACNMAVETSCNRLLGHLQKMIDSEFYDVFDPSEYERTYQFFKSATTEMIKKNTGTVFMDESKMNYNSFWTGKRQLYHASIGSHGGWITDETKEHRFWEVFIDFCQKNVLNIMREELSKQGINTYRK